MARPSYNFAVAFDGVCAARGFRYLGANVLASDLMRGLQTVTNFLVGGIFRYTNVNVAMREWDCVTLSSWC